MKEEASYAFESSTKEKIDISKDYWISSITDINGFKGFYQIPFNIYNDNPFWVPPFWKDTKNFFLLNNPFWSHADAKLFIAYKKDKPVGRIAPIIDYKLPSENDKKIGYFGFFECIDDYEIASGLFKTAEEWLKSKKMDIMRGPINGRIEQYSGFLMEGFNSLPYLLGNYTQRYYLDLVKRYGFKKSKDLISYHIDS